MTISRDITSAIKAAIDTVKEELEGDYGKMIRLLEDKMAKMAETEKAHMQTIKNLKNKLATAETKVALKWMPQGMQWR